MNQGRASIAVMAQRGVPAAIATVALLSRRDGPQASAGKQTDAAAGIKVGPLTKGPHEPLGAIQDRAERAVDAQADAVEDRAKDVRSAADTQADALERQAAQTRKVAKLSAKTLDQQVDAIRGK